MNISNTQSQMSMQPNDSPQSNDDEANDYLIYDEVRMNVFTTVHVIFQSKSLPLISGVVRPHYYFKDISREVS